MLVSKGWNPAQIPYADFSLWGIFASPLLIPLQRLTNWGMSPSLSRHRFARQGYIEQPNPGDSH
jgi:hypothetical protein